MTVTAGRNKGSGLLEAVYHDGTVGVSVRPLASFRIEGAVGAVRITKTAPAGFTAQPGPGNGGLGSPRGTGEQPATVVQTGASNSTNLGIGFVRGLWKQPGTAALVDLRASRALLDATPQLVLNQVMRTEVSARVDFPVTRTVRLRGGARTGGYTAGGEKSTRRVSW